MTLLLAVDDALVNAAQHGDRAALDQLLARVEPLVYRYALSLCRDEEDASEVLQETLLAMARNIGDFRGESSLSTWLYAIARNFYAKQRRLRKDEPSEHDPLDAAHEMAASAASPEEAVAARQVHRAVDDAIGTLAPEYREVLLLRDGEALSAPEVAAVVGISVAAVKSRLHRARLAVRQVVAPLIAPDTLAPPAPGCPDIALIFSEHLEGDVTSDICATMEEHIKECIACREICDSIRTVLVQCRRSGGDEVPAAVQRRVRAALEDLLRPR
jgi:RNA polymerase sigma-70 factor (ECF subfamily)